MGQRFSTLPLLLEVGRLADQLLPDLVSTPLAQPFSRLLGDPLAGHIVVGDVEVGLGALDHREVLSDGFLNRDTLVEDVRFEVP